MKTHARLAALGALGVAAGCVLAIAGFVWFVQGNATGGIDFEHTLIASISGAVIFGVIALIHVVYGRLLLAYAKEHGAR